MELVYLLACGQKKRRERLRRSPQTKIQGLMSQRTLAFTTLSASNTKRFGCRRPTLDATSTQQRPHDNDIPYTHMYRPHFQPDKSSSPNANYTVVRSRNQSRYRTWTRETTYYRLVEHCATYILYAFRFLLSALSWSPKPHRLHSLHAQPRTPCAFSDTQHRDKRELYRRNLMDIVSCTPRKKRHPAIR